MNRVLKSSPPRWYWAATFALLFWNVYLTLSYIGRITMTSEGLAALPEALRSVFVATPDWVLYCYGILAFGGLFGTAALAMRRTWARGLSLAALVAGAARLGWFYADGRYFAVAEPWMRAVMTLTIACAALQLWLALRGTRRGWLQ